MKITIVQGAFLPVPPLRGGAVEKMWYLIGKQLAASGNEVTHICRTFESLPPAEHTDGVEYLRVKGYDTPSSMVKLKLLDLVYSLRVRKVLPKADIIVSNTFWLPMLAAKAHGRLVADVQRMPKGQMRLYRKAARLRANSTPVEKAILTDDSKAQDRTCMIPNPLTFITSQEPDLHQKQNRLLYVGRLHPEKGLDLLLRTWKKIQQANPDWRLRIVGPHDHASGGGGDEYYQKLKAIVPTGQVEFVGAIYDSQALQNEYKQAKVFVYPSIAEKGETFGIAPLEAMAYGCVPVVSSLECFQDFIEHERNGFIFDHRSNAIDALEKLLKEVLNKDTLLPYAQSAIAVRESHSVAAITDQFVRLFQSLMEE